MSRAAHGAARRVDVLALSLGSKLGATAVLLGCVIVIVLGAQSMLGTLEAMDRDIQNMNEEMAVANQGVKMLDTTLQSLPRTRGHLDAIVKTVDSTGVQVRRSRTQLDTLGGHTARIDGRIGKISSSTIKMRRSLQRVDANTARLGTTVTRLDGTVTPLVATHGRMHRQVTKMPAGLDRMGDRLVYIIRVLNHIAAPPGTQEPFTIRAEMPKSTLPPLPGLRAETDPVPVFRRNAWPTYEGP